eukprot:TRINITY_DN9872_c0_g1_i1.p1 TRINITY_DN9872_c0_g1~~TRINITY_DN9872_c0_g1_i1.p1  ORF type:complete len:1146 (-),score=151.98 TRINITY_DN9872_c0_g1_i1:3208-6645(-)
MTENQTSDFLETQSASVLMSDAPQVVRQSEPIGQLMQRFQASFAGVLEDCQEVEKWVRPSTNSCSIFPSRAAPPPPVLDLPFVGEAHEPTNAPIKSDHSSTFGVKAARLIATLRLHQKALDGIVEWLNNEGVDTTDFAKTTQNGTKTRKAPTEDHAADELGPENGLLPDLGLQDNFDHKSSMKWNASSVDEPNEPTCLARYQSSVRRWRKGTSGKWWEGLMMLLTVVGIAQYIAETYLMEDNSTYSEYRALQFLEIAQSSFFAVDLVIRAFSANSLTRFLKRGYTWSDTVALIPVTAVFVNSHSITIFRVLRLFRLFRLLRTYRLSYLTERGTISREIAILGYFLFTLIVSAAAVFQVIEPEQFKYFHNAVYFMVITMATVGYGDYSPHTVLGKMCVCIVVIAAVVIIPLRVNKLLGVLELSNPYAKRFVRTGVKRHVVVTGRITTVTLKPFLEEFFHESHGYLDCFVCVLGPLRPDTAMRLLLEGPLGVVRVTYLQGSPLAVKDMQRAYVGSAKAVFILADRTARDSAASHYEDAQAIITAQSIRQYNEHVPIFAQILHEVNKPAMLSAGRPFIHVVCVRELQAQLLAAACGCPGLQVLVSNLATSHQAPPPDSRPWLRDYAAGASRRIALALAQPSNFGRSFDRVAEGAHASNGTIVLGVFNRSQQVILNPGSQYLLADGDSLLVLCPDLEARKTGGFGNQELLDASFLGRTTAASFKAQSLLNYLDRRGSLQISSSAVLSNQANLSQLPITFRTDGPISTAEAQSIVHRDPVMTMRGHIVVIGNMSNYVPFVLSLRSKKMAAHRPLVFLVTVVPPLEQLLILARFNHVYIVEGTPDKAVAFRLLENAYACAVLPAGKTAPDSGNKLWQQQQLSQQQLQQNGNCVDSSVDFPSMLLFLRLRASLTNVHTLVVLEDMYNARFAFHHLVNDRGIFADVAHGLSHQRGSTKSDTQDEEVELEVCSPRSPRRQKSILPTESRPQIDNRKEKVKEKPQKRAAQRDREFVPLEEYALPPNTAGQICSPDLVDRILCAFFYSPFLIDLIPQLLRSPISGGACSQIFLVGLPRQFVDRCNLPDLGGIPSFADLFDYAVKKHSAVPIALYRSSGEEQNHPPIYYVHTAPAPATPLRADDQVYIASLAESDWS